MQELAGGLYGEDVAGRGSTSLRGGLWLSKSCRAQGGSEAPLQGRTAAKPWTGSPARLAAARLSVEKIKQMPQQVGRQVLIDHMTKGPSLEPDEINVVEAYAVDPETGQPLTGAPPPHRESE